MSNSDTEETARTIKNDEGLYDICQRIARRCTSTSELAAEMESELANIIEVIEYGDVDLGKVDWHDIATDVMNEMG